MTSLINEKTRENEQIAHRRIHTLSMRLKSILERATALNENATRHRMVIQQGVESLESKHGPCRRLAESTRKEWRTSERETQDSTWKPELKSAANRLEQTSPPPRLDRMKDLAVEAAETQATTVQPLSDDIEARSVQLRSSINSITASSRRLLDECEAMRGD